MWELLELDEMMKTVCDILTIACSILLSIATAPDPLKQQQHKLVSTVLIQALTIPMTNKKKHQEKIFECKVSWNLSECEFVTGYWILQ